MSNDQELVRKINVLEGLDLTALKAEYAALYGVEPVTRNVTALRNQIARKLNRQDIDARKKAGKGTAEKVEPAPEKAQKPKPALESDTIVLKRIAELQGLSIPRLREEYEKRYVGPCTSRNKKFLLRRLAEAIRREVGAEAGKVTVTAKFERKSSRSKNISKEKPAEATKGKSTTVVKDDRIPRTGTVIERPYKGKTLRVTVTDSGFEYEGKPFKSLSALAMSITGAKAMNGFLFFRLGQYAKKEKAGK